MLQPRYSKPSVFTSNSLIHSLPTGKGFGGSNLSLDIDGESLLPSIDPQILVAVCPQPAIGQQQPSLLVAAVRIVGLAVWLWCLLGANFCVSCVGEIASATPQSVSHDRG